jgi:phosphatidylglycerophosphate synthase
VTERRRLTIAELRAIAQPPAVMGRRNAEHWAGALYLRRMSIYLTRLLIPTGISANDVTGLMVVVGIAGAAVLVWPSWWALLLCALLMQLQILVDCSDGEVARYRGTTSPAGVYLDRIGHYVTEALLPIGLGVHLDGGVTDVGGWTTIGALTAVVVLLNKAVSDLIHVARAYARLPLLSDSQEAAVIRIGVMAKIRRALRFAPVFRVFVALEFSLIVFALGTVDALTSGVHLLRWWAEAMLPLAVLLTLGHLGAVLLSSRLRTGTPEPAQTIGG